MPITDSVGGAIGYKVFETVENELKRSNWCTYVSNSSLINVFSRYRDNLPQYLKTKEVLSTVADRLKVGSLIRISIINELNGVDVHLEVHGENGEDIYYSENTVLARDDINAIANQSINWLETYSKSIPYDAKINGVLGDQITLDVGKGYPIQVNQEFVVKRPLSKRKHPLLKKIVDWNTEVLADGKVFSISENQALGLVHSYRKDKKIEPGDWVRLEEFQGNIKSDTSIDDEVETPGTLGVVSLALFGSSSSVDTSTPVGSNRMSGNLFGIDMRAEGWITRQYFAAVEVMRSLGTLNESSGNPAKSSINANNDVIKVMGGYKYLPIGFFYGPQIDIYGGYANHSFDLSYSETDGFGNANITGIILGSAANIPINREYRFFAKAEFIPFPTFRDEDNIFGSARNVTAMELEAGIKYQYTARMTLDASIKTLSRKARFSGDYGEISYRDNLLKVGLSFNF